MTTSQLADHGRAKELTGGRGRGPGSPPSALRHRADRCPISGCGEQIDPSRLMCRRHWYAVPRQLRDRVWATWRSGRAAGSDEHREAVRLAIIACHLPA
jgi:hypothetical protein